MSEIRLAEGKDQVNFSTAGGSKSYRTAGFRWAAIPADARFGSISTILKVAALLFLVAGR